MGRRTYANKRLYESRIYKWLCSISCGTLKDVSPDIGVSRAFSTSRYIPGERISYDAKKITYVAIIEAHGRGTSNVVAGYAHKIFGVTGIGASFSDGKVSFGAGLDVLMDIFTNYTHFYH